MTDIIDIAVGTVPDGDVRALALRDLNPELTPTPGRSWARPGPGSTPARSSSRAAWTGCSPASIPPGTSTFTPFSPARQPRSIPTAVSPCGSRTFLLGTFNTSLEGLDITDARLLWNPGTLRPPGRRGAHPDVAAAAEWHAQASGTGFDMRPQLDGRGSALLWVSWSANPVDTDPSYVIQGSRRHGVLH